MAKLITGLLDLFFPPRCVFCGKVLEKSDRDGRRLWCRACRRTLPFTDGIIKTENEIFPECSAPLEYNETVRAAFLRFKFKGKIAYASTFGGIVADEISRAFTDRYDLVTWVPVSREREKKRGYDQSMLLASAAALELDSVAVSTLRKIRDNPAQSGLDGQKSRSENVKGAYVTSAPELVDGKRILLIDDIFTTGSTITECAEMLKNAGAAEVIGAVFAKAVGRV